MAKLPRGRPFGPTPRKLRHGCSSLGAWPGSSIRAQPLQCLPRAPGGLDELPRCSQQERGVAGGQPLIENTDEAGIVGQSGDAAASAGDTPLERERQSA